MKTLSFSLLLVLSGLASRAAITGQWDFETSDLSATTALGIANINGEVGRVMRFPACSSSQGYVLPHGAAPNGGGSKVNQYTLILDVLFPATSTGYRAFWQTDTNNTSDADLFVNGANGIGISGTYQGSLTLGAWHRVAFALDLTATSGQLSKYIDGALVGTQTLSEGVDGRWSLGPTALLFTDDNGETGVGYVSSIQFHNRTLTVADTAALGGPQAAGIPVPQTPSGLQLVSPNGGEVFQAGTTQTVAWVVGNASGLVQVDLLLGDALYRALEQVLMRQSNYLWSIDPQLGDTNTYRIRLTSVDFPSAQDVSDAAFSVTGSGVPPNPTFGQPLQLNGGFESLLTNWQVVAGNPTTLTSSGGEGAPYAGLRFLYGRLSPGGSMIVRQDIDLLAAGFTVSDLDAGAAVDAEARLRNAYSTDTFDDQVYFRVAYLDALSQELASIRSMVSGDNVWVRRTLAGVLPPAARKLRLEVVGKRRRDADNESMADEVTMRVQRAWPLVNPQITKLPMLQDYRQDAMTLFWETDGNLASHAVDWGRTNVSEQTLAQVETVQIDSTHFVHRTTLTGLSPEMSYVYRVRNGTAMSATFSFRTAPLRDTPFAVAWWGDSQENPSVLEHLIPSMLAHGVDWMGVAGDLASSGNSLADWQNYWFTPLETRNIAQTRPALFARGNHDGEYPFSYAYSALPSNEAW